MAEDFGNAHPEVKVVANKSGTGSGVQKFERGEIDIAAAGIVVQIVTLLLMNYVAIALRNWA